MASMTPRRAQDHFWEMSGGINCRLYGQLTHVRARKIGKTTIYKSLIWLNFFSFLPVDISGLDVTHLLIRGSDAPSDDALRHGEGEWARNQLNGPRLS